MITQSWTAACHHCGERLTSLGGRKEGLFEEMSLRGWHFSLTYERAFCPRHLPKSVKQSRTEALVDSSAKPDVK